MRTLAVVPVKRFDAAKARLSEALGPATRAALAEAMLGDVLDALAAVPSLEGVVVVTADERAAEIARAAGADTAHDPREGGQSDAASQGVRLALSRGLDRVALLPGDAPLLDPDELDGLLARAARERLAVALVSDRHGTGTNGLVLTPPAAIVPSFGPGSRARHRAAAGAAGVAHAVLPCPSLEPDVDTPEDLAAVRAQLADAAAQGRARRTRAVVERIATSLEAS